MGATGTVRKVNNELVPISFYVRVFITPGTASQCSDYGMDIVVEGDPCAAISDDVFEDNDSCDTASPLGNGQYVDLLIARDDRDFYSFCAGAGTTVSIDLFRSSAFGRVQMLLREHAGPRCGTSQGAVLEFSGFLGPNETLSYSNGTGKDQELILEVRQLEKFALQSCARYDLLLTGVNNACGSNPDAGTPFCSPMNANSTGVPTRLAGSLESGVGSGLHLLATSGPPSAFGYMLVSTGKSEPGLPVLGGRLCLAYQGGDMVGRYIGAGSLQSIGTFNDHGVWRSSGATASGTGFDVPVELPLPGGATIMSGSTWFFQLWHRDSSQGANFSNGLEASF